MVIYPSHPGDSSPADSPQGGILLCCKGVGSVRINGKNCPDLTLWCDMDPKSSLFFSSICDDSAMLCLNRAIPLTNGVLEPQERRVPYDRQRDLRENLLLAAADMIQKAVRD